MDKDLARFEKKDYMGAIRVSRVSGQANLFASDVQHQHFIEVTICEAEEQRNLSMNWLHAGREIISVAMSEIQWAQFVSSFNQGSGTACTIEHIQGKEIKAPPRPSQEAELFKKEMREKVSESLDSLAEAIRRVSESVEKGGKLPNKTDLNNILDGLKRTERELVANVPFVERQFQEHVERKMAEAKSEFEGYMNGRLRNLGLESLALQAAKENAPKPQFATVIETKALEE